jgi:hypothetical protein
MLWEFRIWEPFFARLLPLSIALFPVLHTAYVKTFKVGEGENVLFHSAAAGSLTRKKACVLTTVKSNGCRANLTKKRKNHLCNV